MGVGGIQGCKVEAESSGNKGGETNKKERHADRPSKPPALPVRPPPPPPQVISNKETKKVFLRLADDRGWTYAENPQDGSVLFEEIGGEFITDA